MTITGFFIAGSLLLGFLGNAYANVQGEKTIRIPKQSDWTDSGMVVSAGPPDSWDTRLSGAISPSTVVKKEGVYFLYYIGADGDRGFPHTDRGPRHRALGVATSTDGIHFIKYNGNPILTFLPNNNDEEGIFSAAATLDKNGNVVLYYGALDAGTSTSTKVHSDVRLAISSNGLDFNDLGVVISHANSSVWGYGDELFPVGSFRANSKWYVYYIAKGRDAFWDLGLAQGSSMNNLSNSKPVLAGRYFAKSTIRLLRRIGRRLGRSGNYIIGGGDPVWLGPDKIGLFILRDFSKRIIEIRTASIKYPAALSTPLDTYNFNDVSHFTMFIDKETKTWFMYYLNSAEDTIRVKTAPISF